MLKKKVEFSFYFTPKIFKNKHYKTFYVLYLYIKMRVQGTITYFLLYYFHQNL